jgi:hypothetical protein
MSGPQIALHNDSLSFYREASLPPRRDRRSSWQYIASFSLTDRDDRAIDQGLCSTSARP